MTWPLTEPDEARLRAAAANDADIRVLLAEIDALREWGQITASAAQLACEHYYVSETPTCEDCGWHFDNWDCDGGPSEAAS